LLWKVSFSFLSFPFANAKSTLTNHTYGGHQTLFYHFSNGIAWKELITKKLELDAKTKRTHLALAPMVFIDGFQHERSRDNTAIGVYLLLANDSVEHLASTSSRELIGLIPKTAPFFQAWDTSFYGPSRN
jgi:hypothetical protein